MTRHKLTSESRQWGKERGGRPEDAVTWFRCTVCGQGFNHRYNIQPDIELAMKQADFDLNACPGETGGSNEQ